MPVKLLNYFNYQMFLSIEPVDIIQFDLLDIWRKNERRHPIVFVIAKDLLKPPVNTVISESAFNTDKQTLS